MVMIRIVILTFVILITNLHVVSCQAQGNNQQLKADIVLCLDSIMKYTYASNPSLPAKTIYILTIFEITDTCVRFSIQEIIDTITFNRDGIYAMNYFIYHDTYILIYFS